jgi:hypothetical protein
MCHRVRTLRSQTFRDHGIRLASQSSAARVEEDTLQLRATYTTSSAAFASSSTEGLLTSCASRHQTSKLNYLVRIGRTRSRRWKRILGHPVLWLLLTLGSDTYLCGDSGMYDLSPSVCAIEFTENNPPILQVETFDSCRRNVKYETARTKGCQPSHRNL